MNTNVKFYYANYLKKKLFVGKLVNHTDPSLYRTTLLVTITSQNSGVPYLIWLQTARELELSTTNTEVFVCPFTTNPKRKSTETSYILILTRTYSITTLSDQRGPQKGQDQATSCHSFYVARGADQDFVYGYWILSGQWVLCIKCLFQANESCFRAQWPNQAADHKTSTKSSPKLQRWMKVLK